MKQWAGGVARSVPGLCESLVREGCRTVLVTQQPHGTPRASLLTPAALVDTRLVHGYDWERWRFSYTPNLSRHLSNILAELGGSVLHDHGLWLHMNHVVARTALRTGTPRVVSPRGMLQEWSLSHRGMKKRIAWRAYQHDDLRCATAFVATSRLEADSIRGLGFRQPIAVIPNGIELPAGMPSRDSAAQGQRTVLFMSRLHPKKGLMDLIQAWAKVIRSGWRLVIAGPDEGGYRSVVESAVQAASLGDTVHFVGEVEGMQKSALLRGADVFVLPSYSENFGIVVGEALAYGTPVITTTATPWEELRSHRCGWWVDPGPRPLQEALDEAMTLSPDELATMGERGRAFVAARFDWRVIARRHIEFYNWIAGIGPQPDSLLA